MNRLRDEAKRGSGRRGALYATLSSVSVLTLLLGAGATAQTPIPGNYAPGAVAGMRAGIMPPPSTFVIENGTLFYNTREFVDSDGDKLDTSETNAVANRTILGYVAPFEILGANYNPVIVLVFTDQLVRPEPDSRRDFQIADMVIQPLAFGWHWDEWHLQASYNLWVPTGRFNAGASNNTGKGLVSHMLSLGTTWLQDSSRPWGANLQVRYEILGRQRDTGIRPGDVMTWEYAAGKEVLEGLDLAILGSASFQTTREKGSRSGTDTSRYRFFGFGPEVSWRPSFLPGSQVAVRVLAEFGARNTSRGVFSILSLSYAF